ncbi:metallothionein-like protein 4A [Vigna umbellata]|uniref:Class II metallothionein-like protein n=2 Tax=Phaseolus angularis TaxID=3914 RepID=A0A0L9U4Q5_PHAAN|nr:metallothionein-like protein 4A [Vigna angularis]XP_047177962.1 metallothionein-like protein 4A [Vigna umbellata]KAG2404789.1 Class II metallothionein-like protein [Vigna angularis]KOM37803.1 hypothetical protein LR48_Vigan03g118500 [Vigna angularis]BAT84274.1 hypothetical protein VIGAN_04159700 [Vigna angularis var. angularis]
MSDRGGDAVRGLGACDNTCGCTVPCPGGSSCRCRSAATTAGGGDHVTCTCGEHCGCNPCSCPKTAAAGSGCRCGSECACVSCRS